MLAVMYVHMCSLHVARTHTYTYKINMQNIVVLINSLHCDNLLMTFLT